MEEVQDIIETPVDGLKEALGLLEKANTKEDFDTIKDTFPELVNNIQFIKNFQFFTRKNLK